ncbi:MAG TPA: diguanylate cyclase [Myxococcales bacterium]|nr:diguanylate cyclase [Myxococcales bacterium]
MADLGPDHTYELKLIFLRELAAGYGPAKTAYDQLRASGNLDKPQLDILRRFFHKLAGTAAAADLSMLGKLAGACETAAEAMIAGKFSLGRYAMQILGDGLTAVAGVLDGKTRSDPTKAAPPPATPPVRIAEGAPRILVVDDDAFGTQLAERVLSAAGFDVRSCLDSTLALQAMRDRAPDLVLLDVDMPKMDGFEVCSAMRKDPALHLIPIVFLTHHGDVERRVRGLTMGGSDYVQKPFDAGELVARVRSHLERAGEYRELTIRDGLTRCYTTEYFKARLDQELARAKRYKNKLVLGLLDIDGFKRINDSYGHAAGDAVLSRLSLLITNSLRASDVVARYAGDEFAFLLLEAEGPDAMAACNRLRETVVRTAFELPETLGGGLRVTTTVSIGLTAYREGDSAHDFLLRADGSLFEAKQQGRNRVLLAP